MWWQVEKNGIPMEEEEEEEVSERKQIFYVIKNFGLDPDPDWATAWIRIRNTGPAGCNARFHITFPCLIIVLAGWKERYSHGGGRGGGGFWTKTNFLCCKKPRSGSGFSNSLDPNLDSVNPDPQHWTCHKAPDCNAGIHDTFSNRWQVEKNGIPMEEEEEGEDPDPDPQHWTCRL